MVLADQQCDYPEFIGIGDIQKLLPDPCVRLHATSFRPRVALCGAEEFQFERDFADVMQRARLGEDVRRGSVDLHRGTQYSLIAPTRIPCAIVSVSCSRNASAIMVQRSPSTSLHGGLADRPRAPVRTIANSDIGGAPLQSYISGQATDRKLCAAGRGEIRLRRQLRDPEAQRNGFGPCHRPTRAARVPARVGNCGTQPRMSRGESWSCKISGAGVSLTRMLRRAESSNKHQPTHPLVVQIPGRGPGRRCRRSAIPMSSLREAARLPTCSFFPATSSRERHRFRGGAMNNDDGKRLGCKLHPKFIRDRACAIAICAVSIIQFASLAAAQEENPFQLSVSANPAQIGQPIDLVASFSLLPGEEDGFPPATFLDLIPNGEATLCANVGADVCFRIRDFPLCRELLEYWRSWSCRDCGHGTGT